MLDVSKPTSAERSSTQELKISIATMRSVAFCPLHLIGATRLIEVVEGCGLDQFFALRQHTVEQLNTKAPTATVTESNDQRPVKSIGGDDTESIDNGHVTSITFVGEMLGCLHDVRQR